MRMINFTFKKKKFQHAITQFEKNKRKFDKSSSCGFSSNETQNHTFNLSVVSFIELWYDLKADS